MKISLRALSLYLVAPVVLLAMMASCSAQNVLPRDEATSAASASAPQIPALHWETRSDWINIKNQGARGDGVADDSAAIQKSLDQIADGATLYFPPGTYRVTQTLSLRNSNGKRWMGGALIGSGRDTRLVWDGASGGTFVLLNGIADSRFIGLELDGRGQASVGFRYKSTQGFQTRVTHRDLAFRGFTDAAVIDQHVQGEDALAETVFENCLFEDCERGVAFLQFNDYDFTFTGCEFRRCGTGIDCVRGNFYVRDSHFENSRVADIHDGSEHGSSIRRCTSTGSQTFVAREATVASLVIQDCHVNNWKSPDGAIRLSAPPALIFDCVFTNAPRDARNSPIAPVRAATSGQSLLVSDNKFEGDALVQTQNRPTLYQIPPGKHGGALTSFRQTFLRDEARIPQRVFDAKRDFGAQGDGQTDDTQAIENTIRAAAAVPDSLAYLPTGNYVITRTLVMTGRDYFVGGSGLMTRLLWRGAAGGVMVEVRDPQNLILQDINIGANDDNSVNNAVDIRQTGSTNGSLVHYNGVYCYGMYQKQPLRKGLQFVNLGAKDVVVMNHVLGNLRFSGCAAATVLANVSYEGSVTVDGVATGEGLLGFQTRLSTQVSHALYLRDNQNIVMSDLYVEQADNGFLFEGKAGQTPGRATIQGAKLQFSEKNANPYVAFDIRNYGGQIFVGPQQFYVNSAEMPILQQGNAPVELWIVGSIWYRATPDVRVGNTARLAWVGNQFIGASAIEEKPIQLADLSLMLDDLRRLGAADLRLNYPTNP